MAVAPYSPFYVLQNVYKNAPNTLCNRLLWSNADCGLHMYYFLFPLNLWYNAPLKQLIIWFYTSFMTMCLWISDAWHAQVAVRVLPRTHWRMTSHTKTWIMEKKSTHSPSNTFSILYLLNYNKFIRLYFVIWRILKHAKCD